MSDDSRHAYIIAHPAVLRPLGPTGLWTCDCVCQRTEPKFGPEQIVADIHGFC
jgi:hypothetical protein